MKRFNALAAVEQHIGVKNKTFDLSHGCSTLLFTEEIRVPGRNFLWPDGLLRNGNGHRLRKCS